MKHCRSFLFSALIIFNLWLLSSVPSYASFEMGPEFPLSIYPEYSKQNQLNSKQPANGQEIDAQVSMGLDYLTGNNRLVDVNQAFLWLKMAESEGSEDASVYLASMYYHGWGTKQNYDEAFKRFSKAAESGNSLAQFNLYIMYDVGYGVLMDKQTALRWLRQSALNGFAPAQTRLGVMYKSGSTVGRDLEKSNKWLRLAAEKGDKEGQFHLAKNYALGIGVEQNYLISYVWLNVVGKECNASELQQQCTDFRSSLANALSTKDIERARQLVDIKKRNIAQHGNSPTVEKVIIQ